MGIKGVGKNKAERTRDSMRKAAQAKQRTSPKPQPDAQMRAEYLIGQIDKATASPVVGMTGSVAHIQELNRKTAEARKWHSTLKVKRRWWGFGSLRAALRGLTRRLLDG